MRSAGRRSGRCSAHATGIKVLAGPRLEVDLTPNPVRPARPRASREVSLRQGHAGKEVQDPVRPEGPLRTGWRCAPGQQETAHQGPSELGRGLRPGQAQRMNAVAAWRQRARRHPQAAITDSRGRDRHCWRPPAQIPASGITALGSCYGYLAANRLSGHGCTVLVRGR